MDPERAAVLPFFTHGPSTYGKVTDLDLCRLMPLYQPPD